MYLVTVEQMGELEDASNAAGHSYEDMMEQAGQATAEVVKARYPVKDLRVLVLVGPGNNGGDGLVCARYLHEAGASVVLYIWNRDPEGDGNLDQALAKKIYRTWASEDEEHKRLRHYAQNADLIVDALLGTGVTRPIEGTLKALLEEVHKIVRARRQRPCPPLCIPSKPRTSPARKPQILAVDVPSGVNCTTGHADPVTLPADLTVTFAFPKVGQFRFPGAGLVGELVVADIGIDPDLVKDISLELANPTDVGTRLPERPSQAHKGSFGKTMIVAGSINYLGAAYLASTAATRVGSGLVTLGIANSLLSILASKLTEVTYLPLPDEQGALTPEGIKVLQEELPDYTAVLLGPGLGQHHRTAQFVRQFLGLGKGNEQRLGFVAPRAEADDDVVLPDLVVIDADGLNALASTPKWWERLDTQAVLTPHPGEMSRLLDRSIEEINGDRIATAQEAADLWGQIVVLKGAYTVIAAPDGRTTVSPFANPGLASAGTGDVLAGTIVGLASQGLDPYAAAVSGVYVHGLAGERVRAELGEAGMVASDLLPQLPQAIDVLHR
jgi:NAD(P)H-hydrate epimerase